MTKNIQKRLANLEHTVVIERAKAVWKIKGIPDPTKEQLEYVTWLAKPKNFAAVISEGLQRRIDQMSKVEKNR